MNTRAIPTNGYETQAAAIVALYKEGTAIIDIIAITGCSVNSAYRAISDYKAKNGIRNQPLRKQITSAPPKDEALERKVREQGVWALSDYDRSMVFHAKAAKAAREARLAK